MKKRCSQNYSDFGLHYGTFRLKNRKNIFLWIYNNLDIHNGNFIILNNFLEVIYHENNMGCLYYITCKDLLNNGEEVLMVTHETGGTGVYVQITDLITFPHEIPDLKVSILKEGHYYNELIASGERFGLSQEEMDSLKGIECIGKMVATSNITGKRNLAIDVISTAQIEERGLSKDSIEKIKNFLKTTFDIEMNSQKTIRAAVIEDLSLPVISLYPSMCPGIVDNFGYKWPLSLPRFNGL